MTQIYNLYSELLKLITLKYYKLQLSLTIYLYILLILNMYKLYKF